MSLIRLSFAVDKPRQPRLSRRTRHAVAGFVAAIWFLLVAVVALRSMRQSGRICWGLDDYNVAVGEFERLWPSGEAVESGYVQHLNRFTGPKGCHCSMVTTSVILTLKAKAPVEMSNGCGSERLERRQERRKVARL